MSYKELEAKRFSYIDFATHDGWERFSIKIETWGQVFEKTAATIDEASTLIWSEFCDFINGAKDSHA